MLLVIVIVWAICLLGNAGHGYRLNLRSIRHVSFASSKLGFANSQYARRSMLSASSSHTHNIRLYEEQVKSVLSRIIDPETGQDILLSKRVTHIDVAQNRSVNIVLASKAANSAATDQIKKFCKLQLAMLDWIVQIKVDVEVPKSNAASSGAPLSPTAGTALVKNVIAISSCKGGVGKSTVAVNLAYSLQQQGYWVGILDADIYGPSLPTMTRPDTSAKIFQGQYLQPLHYAGVKLMSMGFLMGFLSPGAAIMRGPMVNQILNQLVSLTSWGELDFLIVDMPPGTGDIQLTLAQTMNITAAVIVTTPQRLSFVDVVKGIDMFDTVRVPSIAVVENMATLMSYDIDEQFFQDAAKHVLDLVKSRSSSSSSVSVDDLSKELQCLIQAQMRPVKVFGDGHLLRLKEMWGMDHLFSLPLVNDVAASGDSGQPYVLAHPTSDVAKAFDSLAKCVVEEVDRLQQEDKSSELTRSIQYDAEQNRFSFADNMDVVVESKELRCACRCAVCVEELTGRKLLQDDTVALSIRPRQMAPIGRYAWSIDWSDGHKSLYPYKSIRKLLHPK